MDNYSSTSPQTNPQNPYDKKSPQRKFELTAVFNETIYNLWPIFKDKEKIESIISKTNIGLLLPKDTDAKYSFFVVDVCSMECSKTIVYEVSSPQNKMILKLDFNCVSNTLDNSSFVTIIIILKNVDENSPKINSCHFKKFAFDIVNGIKGILEEEPLYDYETIELNCSMKVAWDYMISFDIFKADKNKFDVHKEGDRVVWKILVDPNENKYETQYVQIVSKKCDEGRKKWSFTIEPSRIKMAIKQDIKFIFIKLEEKLTLLTVRHELKEKVSLSHFEFMRNEKQGFIAVLKQSLEQLQKEEDKRKKNLGTSTNASNNSNNNNPNSTTNINSNNNINMSDNAKTSETGNNASNSISNSLPPNPEK